MDWKNRIQSKFATLSPQMQRAAVFVLENPQKVAIYSMRHLALEVGLTPPTFTRLAQSLGYTGFDEIRSEVQERLSHNLRFADRADALISSSKSDVSFTHRMTEAAIDNIRDFQSHVDVQQIEGAALMLHQARRVVVIGALASAGIAGYFGYTAGWVHDNWIIAEHNGISLSNSIASLNHKDALILITMAPYAHRAIASAHKAKAEGAGILVITDNLTSPALECANFGFVVPTESPQFFSSYVPTLLLIETLVGSLVALGGQKAKSRIATIEKTNRLIGEYQFDTSETDQGEFNET